MEKLANLTQTDINNGALNQLLATAGISDVREYVRKFHQETEDLIVEDLAHTNSDNANDDDEQIVPPADIARWISGLRPRLNDPSQQLLSEEQSSQQQLPQNVHSLIFGLRPHLDKSIETSSHKQHQEKQPPTDLISWMQSIAPVHLCSSIDTTTTTSNDDTQVSGNLGTWLNDWSKNLAQLPPPTSLDNWLQSLVCTNLHEPIGKAASPKGRLNSYLNAAQQVLSDNGYKVATEVIPPTSVKADTGMHANVKQMYFLWKTLDKNHDHKITVEDVQIMLQEMGLGFLSRYAAQTLFDMVDSNHDGTLQFHDFVALMGIIKQLITAMGSTKTRA